MCCLSLCHTSVVTILHVLSLFLLMFSLSSVSLASAFSWKGIFLTWQSSLLLCSESWSLSTKQIFLSWNRRYPLKSSAYIWPFSGIFLRSSVKRIWGFWHFRYQNDCGAQVRITPVFSLLILCDTVNDVTHFQDFNQVSCLNGWESASPGAPWPLILLVSRWMLAMNQQNVNQNTFSPIGLLDFWFICYLWKSPPKIQKYYLFCGFLGPFLCHGIMGTFSCLACWCSFIASQKLGMFFFSYLEAV